MMGLSRSLSKKKNYNSAINTIECHPLKSDDKFFDNFSNRTSFSSQNDGIKKPTYGISKSRRESSYGTEQSSPLCNCFTPSNENNIINNEKVNINKVEGITYDKKIIKENSNCNINDKEHYKAFSNSNETIDEAKLNIVLCRICEEMILAENLSEHSKVCAVIQEQEMRLYECTQKLKKLNNEFKSLKNTMVMIAYILK